MEILRKIFGPNPDLRVIVFLLVGIFILEALQLKELEDLPDDYPEPCGYYGPCEVEVVNTVNVNPY